METMKLNIKETTDIKDKDAVKKDFAESIKLLEI
jgi:serine/threonine protein kinase